MCIMMHIEVRVKISSNRVKRRQTCLSHNRERHKIEFPIMSKYFATPPLSNVVEATSYTS